ncbi:MAG: hypothetical protein IJU86_03035 [Firmicutes bacterium]|nr:hypothetical protein [Bacillota bacterium]
MQNIKHNLIQGNNRENKSDGFDFSGVSEINDLCFKNEFDRVNCFSYIIAVVYAISLVILGLSLIFIPTAISIYITLSVLVVVPIAIALYRKKQKAQKDKQDENKIFTDAVVSEINSPDLFFCTWEQKQGYYLSQKIEINIKPILKLAIYFFIFAFIGVAVNLIFLQTIFIYISLAILAIIIFSVGYKIHKINSQIKNLNDINYDDDIVDIEEWITEKNIAQEDPEISEIENINLSIR